MNFITKHLKAIFIQLYAANNFTKKWSHENKQLKLLRDKIITKNNYRPL